MQEEQLIEGLRARDRKTTEYLYEKYSRALYAVIARILSDQDIAEEVFHDAFIKITKKLTLMKSQKGAYTLGWPTFVAILPLINYAPKKFPNPVRPTELMTSYMS
ncbi:RNA polymerase sigma factor [Algoriphagus boritolerans]|uniref:RNA polymerase sigma factor n=1 Tax=Algoriphagus boritolerans TaxID=308111 RepID=UPI000AFB8949